MARAGHPDEQREFSAVGMRVHFKALKRRAGGPNVVGRSLVGIQLPNRAAGVAKFNGVFPAIAAAREAELQAVAGGKDGVRVTDKRESATWVIRSVPSSLCGGLPAIRR